MPIGPHPEFSWSQSRRGTFRECPRMYFYQYYASHKGWEEDAAPEAARAWRLKQITNLYLLLGSVVHELAAESIQRSRNGESPDDLATLIAEGRRRLNRAWNESQDRDTWERDPRSRTMLHEFYYGPGPSGPLIEQIRGKLERCLAHLLESRSYREAIEAPYVEVKETDRLDVFDLEGVRIYAAPDLVYRLGSGVYRLVDWKTGGGGDEDLRQLRAYALYLRSRNDLEPGPIEGCLEFLNDGTHCEALIPDEHSDEEADSIRASIAMMRGYLADPEANVPLPKESFALNADFDSCQHCRFYELDREEIDARAEAGPF